MRRAILMLAALALIGATGAAAKAPETWDGLVLVKAKKVAAAYLLPHADFRAYSKVMFDPAEVAFRKNWQRDFNRSTSTLGGRISDKEMRDAINEAQSSLDKIFAENFTREGVQVVNAPGADVLRLSVYVVDITVNAPDVATSAMTRTYSLEAGEATLALEARDSLTGQLLGRIVDPRVAGDGPTYRRTYSSNRADFEALFETWAKLSARGLTELRAASPIDTDGLRKK